MPRTRVVLLAAVAALGSALLLAPVARAHGGTYRPPAGEEPPPPPPDPPPPPPPPPPAQEDPPPPPPPPPRTPEPPPSDPPSAPQGPTSPPPSGPPAPPVPPGGAPRPPRPPDTAPNPNSGRSGRRSQGPDLEDWSVWWAYSRDRYLARRGEGTASGGGGLGVTTGSSGDAPDAVRGGADRAWREGALAALRKVFPDPDVEVFTGAAVALGKAGDPRDAAVLIETLRGRYRNPSVRESVVLALGLLGREAPGARDALLSILRDRTDSARLRGFAALALGLSGDPGAAPALLAAARERGPQRDPAAGALVGLGLLGEDLVVPDLAAMLDDASSTDARALRPFAAFALGRIGGAEAVRALGRALGDGDAQVRRAAVLALGECDPADAGVLAAAAAHMAREDRDRPCRSFAMVTLGRLGGPAATETLFRCFGLGDRGERNFASLGLALCARSLDDADVRTRIASLLREQFEQREDVGYRGALAVALGLLRDAKAAPALRSVLRARGDPALRAHCAVALGLVGAVEASDDLRAALSEKGAPEIQREAALALGLLGDPGAARVLADLVAAPGSTEHLRASAAMALGQLRGPEAAAALTGLLLDEAASDAARGQAAVGLGLLLDPRPDPAMSALSRGLDYLAPVGVLVEALTIP